LAVIWFMSSSSLSCSASACGETVPTANGRYLLVPQGSRLIGPYDSQVTYGQRRMLLVWTRLILPDTSSIALDKLPGIDPAGYAGLEEVDWHWSRIMAGAALATLLGEVPNSPSRIRAASMAMW
jgi:type IV secretion system protein TrbI